MKRNSRKANSAQIFAAVTLLAVFVFALSFYFSSNEEGSGVVVAKVNGEKIYQSELEQKLRGIFDVQGEKVKTPSIDNLPKEVLDVLIKETYLDKKIAKLAKSSEVSGDKQVKQEIAEAQNRILRNAYIKFLVSKEVTDQKVSEKYAEVSSSLTGKKEYRVYHIVAKSKADAEKVRKDLTAKKKAIKFAEAAKKFSLDKESSDRGGELGFILEDNMIKEISDAIQTLKENEISAPVQTKFGWHLVKFTETREVQSLPFDSVKQNIREQLEQDKINEIESNIVKDAKVEILLGKKDEKFSKDKKSDEQKSSSELAPSDQEALKSVEESINLEQKQLESKSEESSVQSEEKAEKSEEKSQKQADEKSKEAKSSKKHRH
jgi:peptidyl-prolyl cis-trans isomerase C